MVVASTNGSYVEKSPYELKPGPYSSHTLALQALPKRGEGRWVLDVGCGAGDGTFLAAELVGPTGSVVGIDSSPSALQTAQLRDVSAHAPTIG